MSHPRQQRGLEIAATARIVKKGAAWLVPSQSGNGRYKVNPEKPHCNCPDHELRGVKCKHIIAVEYVIQRECHADGSTTITETNDSAGNGSKDLSTELERLQCGSNA